MRRGVDTNVLIYAHVPAFEQHQAVRSFLEDQLNDPTVTLVITAGVLHEFVHVITDPRRFDPPVAMAEALALARGYMGRSNVAIAPTDEATVQESFALLSRHGLGRKRMAESLLMAALANDGVTELITCNRRDFEGIGTLAVVNPCG